MSIQHKYKFFISNQGPSRGKMSICKYIKRKRVIGKDNDNTHYKLEKKYAPALDNYGQSCFVRSDFFFCKTQMMPPPRP